MCSVVGLYNGFPPEHATQPFFSPSIQRSFSMENAMFTHENIRKAIRSLSTSQLRRLRSAINERIKEKEINKRSMSAERTEKYRGKRYNEALKVILEDDWSDLFSSYSDDGSDFYVYFHGKTTARKGYEPLGVVSYESPIYVGLGQGDRAFNFNRSPRHRAELKKLTNSGFTKDEIVHIIATGMSESEARELESKLIIFFGIVSFKSVNDKRKCSMAGKRSLLNAKYEPYP